MQSLNCCLYSLCHTAGCIAHGHKHGCQSNISLMVTQLLTHLSTLGVYKCITFFLFGSLASCMNSTAVARKTVTNQILLTGLPSWSIPRGPGQPLGLRVILLTSITCTDLDGVAGAISRHLDNFCTFHTVTSFICLYHLYLQCEAMRPKARGTQGLPRGPPQALWPGPCGALPADQAPRQ